MEPTQVHGDAALRRSLIRPPRSVHGYRPAGGPDSPPRLYPGGVPSPLIAKPLPLVWRRLIAATLVAIWHHTPTAPVVISV